MEENSEYLDTIIKFSEIEVLQSRNPIDMQLHHASNQTVQMPDKISLFSSYNL